MAGRSWKSPRDRIPDTDYAAKGRYAIDTLKSGVDFKIVVHVEATDEASHEGHAMEKVKALEEIDRHIVDPLHTYLKSQGDYRLLICPDHPTFSARKPTATGTFRSRCAVAVSRQICKELRRNRRREISGYARPRV